MKEKYPDFEDCEYFENGTCGNCNSMNYGNQCALMLKQFLDCTKFERGADGDQHTRNR